MTDTSAKILAKGCDKTGITPELAQQLYAGGRTSILAIVELEVVQDHTNRVSGKNAVDLAITTIEPVISNSTVIEERAQEDIRRVAKALFVNRKMRAAPQGSRRQSTRRRTPTIRPQLTGGAPAHGARPHAPRPPSPPPRGPEDNQA